MILPSVIWIFFNMYNTCREENMTNIGNCFNNVSCVLVDRAACVNSSASSVCDVYLLLLYRDLSLPGIGSSPIVYIHAHVHAYKVGESTN